jgi:hypothetical protein
MLLWRNAADGKGMNYHHYSVQRLSKVREWTLSTAVQILKSNFQSIPLLSETLYSDFCKRCSQKISKFLLSILQI